MLFNNERENRPLAEILRPSRFEDFIGQQHLLDEGRPLALALKAQKIHSMILWGPPGVGKTSLARLVAQSFDCHWEALSAVFAGVKDIRAVVEKARQLQQLGQQMILFIDEIHRFNKAQQDALLPYTESGLITFIGATTENPSFEVNKALLSRAQVYVLHSLNDDDLEKLITKTEAYSQQPVIFSDEAKQLCFAAADGDGRRMLNLLEQIIAAANVSQCSEITAEWLKQLLGSSTRRFDKGGDQFYDQISALHKSVRGSDPDAALYWFCRMIDGGVSAAYLSRRIIRMAWEDIGLADPRAIQLTQDACETYERLGSPEGELALAQAVIYLAVAAKSNAGYLAYKKAMAFVKNDKSREVPPHLRNAPTALMKNLGYSRNYRYAHDEPYGYAAGEHYFPEDMEAMNWYQPVDRGLEKKIRDKLDFLHRLDEALV